MHLHWHNTRFESVKRDKVFKTKYSASTNCGHRLRVFGMSARLVHRRQPRRGDKAADACPLVWLCLNTQSAFQNAGPVLHVAQPHPLSLSVLVKSVTVIFNGK